MVYLVIYCCHSYLSRHLLKCGREPSSNFRTLSKVKKKKRSFIILFSQKNQILLFFFLSTVEVLTFTLALKWTHVACCWPRKCFFFTFILIERNKQKTIDELYKLKNLTLVKMCNLSNKSTNKKNKKKTIF
jgi:hypothetical protein